MSEITQFFTHNPFIASAIGISAVIAMLAYMATFSSVFQKEIKRRRMKHRIDSLRDHYIIAGFGRVGTQIAKELASEGRPFVIIERDEHKLDVARDNNWLTIVGDAAVDETLLQKAGIAHAKAVVVAVGADADVIFIAISARSLRPDVFIVARASSVEAGDKLTKIGVNRIALPYQIGGYHMATMALRPMVVDFLDLLIDSDAKDLEMEELTILDGGRLDGQSIAETNLLDNNVSLPIIRSKSGRAKINPGENYTLKGGDRIVAMGSQSALKKLIEKVEQIQGRSHATDRPNDKTLAGEIKPAPFESR